MSRASNNNLLVARSFRHCRWFVPSIAVLLALLGVLGTACSERIKEPAVAGAFYPGEKAALGKMVDGFLEKAAEKPVEGRLVALISPHAGYVFSGQVAASGYRNLKGRGIRTVYLIGPSHREPFLGASVYPGGSFRTPLGKVKVDSAKAGALLKEEAGVYFHEAAFGREHSLEVQLPFLQRVLERNFKIVPIVMGTHTEESFGHLASRLTAMIKDDEKSIIIASTDLSHYHGYDRAVRMDRKVTGAIERMSLRTLDGLTAKKEGELCGLGAVRLTMEVARRVGANYGVLYKYANSGDVIADKSRVVGYASIGLFKSPLSRAEKEELITLARGAVVDYVKNGHSTGVTIDNPKLRADGAVFVTIKRNGRLRGCIGNIIPVMPLYESVLKNAVAACSKDRRFAPMTPAELKDMEIEISILSPLVPVEDPSTVKVGRDGLYISRDGRGGLLLPQVPVEFGWNRTTFLEQVSQKAGLPKNAWKLDGTRLFRFSAEIIGG